MLLLAVALLAETFSGQVVQDSTGAPVRSAQVKLRQAGVRELIADLETDSEGRFAAEGVRPGAYALEVSKANFVAATLRIRVPGSPLAVRLVRCGVISGRVTDAEGRPLAGRVQLAYGRTVGGALVTLFARAPDGALKAVRDPVEVEEGGRYRLYNLPPGQYAVALMYGGLRGGTGSGAQFYPSNENPRLFEISGGEEYRDVDFEVQPGARRRVSGRVALPQPGMMFALSLIAPAQPALAVARALADKDGAFHFDGIAPGEYHVLAAGPDSGYTALQSVLGAEPYFGRASVTVSGQDVDDVTVGVERGRSVQFALRAAPGVGGCAAAATLTLTATEFWGARVDRTLEVNFLKPQTLADLAPARYALKLSKLGATCFQAGPATLDLTAAPAGPLTLTVAAAGAIQGRLLVAAPAHANEFVVVLLDAETGSVEAASPDAQARFAFAGLRPGKYRIAAQPASAARTRWVAELEKMTEIEVLGGALTNIDLAARRSER